MHKIKRFRLVIVSIAVMAMVGFGFSTAQPAQACCLDQGQSTIYNGGGWGGIGVAHYTNQYGYDAILWPGQHTLNTFGWDNAWGYWVGQGSCVYEERAYNRVPGITYWQQRGVKTWGWHYAENGYSYRLTTLAGCTSW